MRIVKYGSSGCGPCSRMSHYDEKVVRELGLDFEYVKKRAPEYNSPGNEEIKKQIGSAYPLEEEIVTEIKGRDLVAAIPRTIEISSAEIREALADPINAIIEAVLISLERTPPEVAADILDRGITLTGGGALLRGLDERIRRETNLPVHVAEDPLTCVVRGTGKILQDVSGYRKVLY